ncbi:anther-specific proline-rich protein APG-like [Cryptomeria japonica]|uniref:anther-specific proline-rich protein APG-like n=1 Tax=Cryptomeria japonica TaxID=3369 RepID=UPI0027D9DAD3|nr:anther-specific proline-rich protein APG-like [Cryptomeria japonica]
MPHLRRPAPDATSASRQPLATPAPAPSPQRPPPPPPPASGPRRVLQRRCPPAGSPPAACPRLPAALPTLHRCPPPRSGSATSTPKSLLVPLIRNCRFLSALPDRCPPHRPEEPAPATWQAATGPRENRTDSQLFPYATSTVQMPRHSPNQLAQSAIPYSMEHTVSLPRNLSVRYGRPVSRVKFWRRS